MKITYRRPRLELYSPSKDILNVLTSKNKKTTAYSIKLRANVNETPELNFIMPFFNGKLSVNDCEKLVKLNNDYFIIKEIVIDDSDKSILNIRAIHEASELKGILCSSINLIASNVEEMFNVIIKSSNIELNNYRFGGTDIQVDVKRHLEGDSEKSVFENLVAMSENFDCWMEFSTRNDGVIEIYFRKSFIDKGRVVKKGKDLGALGITYNTDEIFTKLTAFGATSSITGEDINLMKVNNGKPYIEDYSYYLAMGLTENEIRSSPKCNQEYVYRKNSIFDAKELLSVAQDELKKCSQPIVSSSISIIDTTMSEGSILEAPILSEKIVATNRDIGFNIEAMITGFERDYDNPLNTTIEISNIIKYNNIFKDLVAKSDAINKVTNKDSGDVKVNARSIKGNFNANDISIIGSINENNRSAEIKNNTVIVFENRIVGSETFGALAIGIKGILCSNELDENKNQ